MLAVDEVSVAIDGIAVDEMRVVDHDLDATVRLPAEHPPPDDIRPDEAALERVPDRTFAEGGVIVEAEERRRAIEHLGQTRVPDHDPGKILDHLGFARTAQENAGHGFVIHCCLLSLSFASLRIAREPPPRLGTGPERPSAVSTMATRASA